jgi:nucleoside-diphosphate-sugar epimerase
MEKKNNKKKIALIGYSGFIGSNLKKLYKSQFNYNSKNIFKIKNKKFDLVLCAGTPSKRWIANKKPKEDLQNIKKLTKALKDIKTKMFVLISSIEIYGNDNNKSENNKINLKKNSEYGKNRLYLEKFVKKKFNEHLIIRLPIVYGKKFSKNAIFDLINDNEIEKLNGKDLIQIYHVKNLKKDINFSINKKIREINISTEPITLKYLAKKVFNKNLSNNGKKRSMRMKSIYSKNSFFYSKKYLIKELINFVKKNP